MSSEEGKKRTQTKVQTLTKTKAVKGRASGKPRGKATEASAHLDVGELHQRVSERSFYIFLERGGEHGLDLEDWLKAEAIELHERK